MAQLLSMPSFQLMGPARISGEPMARESSGRTNPPLKWRPTIDGPSGTGGVVRVMLGHYPQPHDLSGKRGSRRGRLMVARRFNAGERQGLWFPRPVGTTETIPQRHQRA